LDTTVEFDITLLTYFNNAIFIHILQSDYIITPDTLNPYILQLDTMSV